MLTRKYSNLFSFQSLDESSHVFLRSFIRGDARQLGVDVKGALELEEVPVVLDHLGRGAVLAVLPDDVVEEDDLRQLHRHVVLVGARPQVRHHGGPDAERRDGDPAKLDKWIILDNCH